MGCAVSITKCPLRVCHETLVDMTKIRKCSCKRLAKARYEYYSESKEIHCNGYDRAFLAGYSVRDILY